MNDINLHLEDQLEEARRKHAQSVKLFQKSAKEYARQLEESHQEREALQKELKGATTYMGKLEGRVLEANQNSLDLLKRLRNLELENEALKNYIIDLKAKVAVYVPFKDDAIDHKIAEFINNYPDRSKLKIMFMRESSGVYTFGSKKVTVRVEKSKIQIRVGGGYMSIDEFLDQHTPAELEKIERRDPLKRFSEKVALQKAVAGKEVNGTGFATSPNKHI